MNGLGLTVYLFESVQVSFCLIYRFSSSNLDLYFYRLKSYDQTILELSNDSKVPFVVMFEFDEI